MLRPWNSIAGAVTGLAQFCLTPTNAPSNDSEPQINFLFRSYDRQKTIPRKKFGCSHHVAEAKSSYYRCVKYAEDQDMTDSSKWNAKLLLGKNIFCVAPLEGADTPVLPPRCTDMFLRPGYLRGFYCLWVCEGKSWKNHTLLSSAKTLSSAAACNPQSVFLLLTFAHIPLSVLIYLEFVLPVFLFFGLILTISVLTYPQFHTLSLTTACVPGGFPFDPCTAWLSQGEATKVTCSHSFQLLNHCSPKVESTQCIQDSGRTGFQLDMS